MTTREALASGRQEGQPNSRQGSITVDRGASIASHGQPGRSGLILDQLAKPEAIGHRTWRRRDLLLRRDRGGRGGLCHSVRPHRHSTRGGRPPARSTPPGEAGQSLPAGSGREITRAGCRAAIADALFSAERRRRPIPSALVAYPRLRNSPQLIAEGAGRTAQRRARHVGATFHYF